MNSWKMVMIAANDVSFFFIYSFPCNCSHNESYVKQEYKQQIKKPGLAYVYFILSAPGNVNCWFSPLKIVDISFSLILNSEQCAVFRVYIIRIMQNSFSVIKMNDCSGPLTSQHYSVAACILNAFNELALYLVQERKKCVCIDQ